MRTIIEDTRQKKDLHQLKHDYWDEAHIIRIRSALPFGDYIAAPKIAVDTKQNIHEIALNLNIVSLSVQYVMWKSVLLKVEY